MKKLIGFALLGLSLPALAEPAKAPSRPHATVNIERLLAQMTLEEKLGQIQQITGVFPVTGPGAPAAIDAQMKMIKAGKVGSMLNTLGAKMNNQLQRVAVNESRLHIPILIGYDTIHGHRTIFPTPLGEAASFDPAGCEESAAVAANEAQANGVRWTFAPMVDIARDARWGRVVEGSGEDTYLGSVLAAARVKGFQRGGKFAACAKHWVGYGRAEAGRDYNTVDMSDRTLREVYLPPFKAAVDAGVATFMTAFNELNGVPSTANRYILTDILRGEWHFKGLVVSDYEAVSELLNHGIAADGKEAARVSLHAGMDMEMVSAHIAKNGAQLVAEKKLTVAEVDEAVRRILRVKQQLGLFEDPYTDESKEDAALFNPAHRALARQVAARSCVLLKNDNNVLPFSKTVKTVAIVGPLGDSGEDILGPWHGDGRGNEAVTILAGVRKKLPDAKVIFVKGCDVDGKEALDKTSISQAIFGADVVLVTVGERSSMSGEASCRSNIDLPGHQTELVKLVHESGKPYAVILQNGRPLSLRWVADTCPSILEAWFPGSEGGNAIADVVFGDVNPGGKLPISFPRSVGQCPIYYNFKNTGRPSYLRADYVSTYLDVPNDPQFVFGHGLSYTTFKIDQLQLSGSSIKPDGKVTVTASVQNTGKRAGDEVVQLYVHDRVSSVTRPVRELKGFERVTLQPGESKRVSFTLGQRELGFYDLGMKWVVEPGDFDVFVGDSSKASLKGSFTVR